MRDKLLTTIYRLGSLDQLGEAEESKIRDVLGIDTDELIRLAGQLEQLGYLTYHRVSVGSFKLTGSGITEAERLIRRGP